MINSPFKDSPNTLNDECVNIDLNLEKINNELHICWNIPDSPKHYNGYLLLLDTKPITNAPNNQQFYQADNTADYNKHVGDRIDTSLIIGTYYNDIQTNEIIITDALDNENYYVAGFGVDNVRDYSKPSHSYQIPSSLNKKTDDTKGYQIIKLGILPDDEITINNNLNIYIDSVEHTLPIVANNYQELIDDINLKIIQIDKVHVGDSPNNTNGFSIRNNQLYKFDGTKEHQQEFHISENPPNDMQDGEYWINDGLYQWFNEQWNELSCFKYYKPINELSINDYWFDGKDGYKFDEYKWDKITTHHSDPSTYKSLKNNAIWFDGTNFKKYKKTKCNSEWETLDVYESTINPLTYTSGYYWLNDNKIYQLLDKVWKLADIKIDDRPEPSEGIFWYNSIENKVYGFFDEWKHVNIDIIKFNHDVTIPDNWLWFDGSKLNIWDSLHTKWLTVNYIQNDYDPTIPTVKTGDLWFNDNLKYWDGSQWNAVDYFTQPSEPLLNDGDYFHDSINNNYWRYLDGQWNDVQGCSFSYDKSILNLGQFWFNPKNSSLSFWNGLNWQSLWYSAVSLLPSINDLWYNSQDNKLYKFIGSWVEESPKAFAEIVNGDIKFTSNTLGSKSSIGIHDSYNGIMNLFYHTSPRGSYQKSEKGTDGLSDQPLYKTSGIGVDDSNDERKNLIDNLYRLFGYPMISVELDRSHMDLAVDLALSNYRKLTSNAYKRKLFFLDLEPNKQNYILNDATVGFDRIVTISAVNRRNSAFLANPSGGNNGAFAQQMLQYMYNPTLGMDFATLEAISQYGDLAEKMLSSRLVHMFDERTRRLDIMQNIGVPETVILDTSCERTENELIVDRLASAWLQNWSFAEASLMLANIRGKYSSLPSANGSTSLNSADLISRANEIFEKCKYEVDNYIVDNIESYGAGSMIMIG
jgi:hypothetical protein